MNRRQILLAFSIGAINLATVATAQSVTTLDVGTLGGFSQPMAINDAGQVVGWSSLGPALNYHAFVWTATDGLVDLGTLAGPFGISRADGINNKGQIVGLTTTLPTYNAHAFLLNQAGRMVDLGTIGDPSPYSADSASGAAAVNDNGDVVGGGSVAPDGQEHAFLWTAAEGMIDLGTLGGTSSTAFLVNGNRRVAGQSYTAENYYHGFSWTTGEGMVDLGSLGGGEVDVFDMSNRGEIVGRSAVADGTLRAFSWTPATGMTPLETLPGATHSVAWAVNDNGYIAGSSSTGNDTFHAVLWTPNHRIVDLGTLEGDSYAVDISETGQIVGFVDMVNTDGGETIHAFSWSAATGMIDLGSPLSDSYAVAVNNRGQVVGWSRSCPSADTRGTMWVVRVQITTAIDRLVTRLLESANDPGIMRGLSATLVAASANWQGGHSSAVLKQLDAFVRKADAQRGKAIDETEADQLIEIARAISSSISNGTAE